MSEVKSKKAPKRKETTPDSLGSYTDFLSRKYQSVRNGLKCTFMPKEAFNFQQELIEWSLATGRSALFEDCGLGKTLQELTWSENVVRQTNGNVLVLAPLAVSSQTVREGEKFGIEVHREYKKGITVTNYEQMHKFDSKDFIGLVADESSVLKNFDGIYRKQITEFMRQIPYRLCGTATAAPNDYTEVGTTSEALGYLGHLDMLNRFFRNQNNTSDTRGRWRPTDRQTKGGAQLHAWEGKHWRFKGHAERAFWQWMCSWSRAIRKPSDLGYEDLNFILPELTERQHVIECDYTLSDYLFSTEAVTLNEQREERRMTLKERCEKVASLVAHDKPALVWCHLNEEGKLLKNLISGATEVSGNDSTEVKEEKLLSFIDGQSRVLITKPKIGGFGLNLQHCSHVTFFPSHSFEQYYQGVRRCWRFGQKNPVTVDIVTTEGERKVLQNLQRKAVASDRMFTSLVAEMKNELSIQRSKAFEHVQQNPSWLISK